MDPLKTKYPSMSPFTGYGNNPIIFVDPDGGKIIKPTPNLLYNNDQFVKDYNRDVEIIKKSKIGKSLISKLESTEVVIRTNNAGRFYYTDKQDVLNSGTIGANGSTVQAESINTWYAQRSGINVSDIKAYSFRVLAHEYFHAEDMSSGYNAKIVKDHKLTGDVLSEIQEIRAMVQTNLLMKELGVDGKESIRTKYEDEPLLKSDGVTPIKDYGFDILEGIDTNPSDSKVEAGKNETGKNKN